MTTAYWAQAIRGKAGEKASHFDQKEAIQLAKQYSAKVRAKFPDLELTVPHTIEEFNVAYFEGRLNGDEIVAIECRFIHLFDVLIVCGTFHEGTGVAQEILHAHEHGVHIIFIDDVGEESLQHLAEELSRL